MTHIDALRASELILLPEISQAKYAEMIGVSSDTVRGMVQRGHLPTIKRGKHRLINLALIYSENVSAA